MKELVDLTYLPLESWNEHARRLVAVALSKRYQRVTEDGLLEERGAGEKRFQVRINASTGEKDVPFFALIPPDQDRSGAYGGMSFVMFPQREPGAPALIGMVVGTHGLAPDEDILGRPGHARKMRAIATWLRQRGARFAWAKQDPVRIDLDLPRTVRGALTDWDPALKRYGKVLYSAFAPSEERSEGEDLVADAVAASMDVFFAERDIEHMASAQEDAERIRSAWLSVTLPTVREVDVRDLLHARKYVVLEGPPGTGKTDLAGQLLKRAYGGNGRTIQFHPGTTYESFIGGLAPSEGGSLGFTFTPTPGHLMEAAAAAAETPDSPYLLVIDEINRADLSKVLGEAIHLLEPGRHSRSVRLAHDFPGHGRSLTLPPNLHVLGTMNSADRSIAILDLAVRRRFAFTSMWPQLSVVERHSGPTMQRAFQDLLMLFVEYAQDDAFALMPGHAYFLASEEDAQRRLSTDIMPLLREYLELRYVAGFADELQAFLDRYAATNT